MEHLVGAGFIIIIIILYGFFSKPEPGIVKYNSCIARLDCKGSFEFIPPHPSKIIDFGVQGPILPYAKEPTKRKSVYQCFDEWIQLKNNVGNHQFPRSTHNEDVTIWKRYFNGGVSNGYFLELGAFDGVAESNTRFFERCLGWGGLLIEANPIPFETLRTSRPYATKLHLAPSCKEETTVLFNPTPWTNAKTANIRASIGKETPNGVEVHCAPLATYLKYLEITEIDFMSLDVEGSELSVLETIDFDAVKIKVLMVESKNTHNPGGNSPQNVMVRKFLHSKGFTIEPAGTVQHSDVYLSN